MDYKNRTDWMGSREQLLDDISYYKEQLRKDTEAFVKLQVYLHEHAPQIPKGDGIEEWAINYMNALRQLVKESV